MSSSSTPGLRHVLLGGYTAEADGHAVGVTSLLNTASGAGRVVLSRQPDLRLTSPTWLIQHPVFPIVFAAGETTPATVSSLRLDPDGRLTLLSSVETGGNTACHLALSEDGQVLLVANYGSGSVSTFAVAANGTLSGRIDLFQLDGSGPDPDRQAGPHAHQIVRHGSELLVSDLGSDRIHRLTLDDAGRLGRAASPLSLPAGSGPRHLLVFEEHLVVVCELSGELWLGRWTGEDWEHRQSVPSSASPDGLVQPSGITADAERIFVANRGVDTIAVFDLDPASDRLSCVAEFPSGGAWPRDLVVDDGLLWVANQHSDLVAVFEVSPLPPAGSAFEITAPSPARVLLVRERRWTT